MAASTHHPVSRTLREPGGWTLVALGMAYFARVLFFGQTLYFRDLYLIYLPQRRLLAELWRSGVVPLWNPLYHGGIPLLADISNAALYPSTLLYWVFPNILAFNLEIVLHLIGASLAAYLLARSLGLGQGAAFVTGVGFAYCGFALSLTNLLVVHLARPYLPLMLWTWHRFLTGNGRRWLLGTVLLGGLQVLAGGPEMIAISHLTLALWGLGFARGWRRLLRISAAWLAVVAGVLALGAVQLLPTAEMLAGSPRGSGFDYAAWSRWSLPPSRLPELLVPGFFGPVDTYAVTDYWGMQRIDFGFPYMLGIYAGIALVALAGLGLSSRGRLPRRLVLMLAGLTVVAVVAALGRSWPFFELIYHALAPVRIFRFPIKALGFATLPLAMLAGLGFDAVVRGHHSARAAGVTTRMVNGSLWAVTLGGGLLASVLRLGPSLSAPLLALAFGRSDDTVRLGLAAAFAHTTLFAALTALLLAACARRAPSGRRFAPLLLALAVAMDLMIAGRPLNPAAPATLLEAPPRAAARVRAVAGDGRLYRTEDPPIEVPVPGNEAIWRYRLNIEGLAFYLGASYGIPVIFHQDYDGLAPARIVRLERLLESLPWERRVGLLSAAGVSAVLTREAPRVPGLELRAVIEVPGPPLELFRNTHPVPQARLVARWQPAPNDDLALRALAHPRFDPRRHAVISSQSAREHANESCSDPDQGVRVLEHKPERWRLETHSVCDTYLVLQMGFDPGWKVRVDHLEATPERADFAFSAVFLPAGTHRVEWRYAPRSVTYGAALSCATLLLLVGLLMAGRARSWTRSLKR